MLVRYLDQYLNRMDGLLRADGSTARVRLMRYWSCWNASQCGIAQDGGAELAQGSKCLIVKLSAEVADISETMRLALRSGTDRVVQRIAACIDEGHADGSIPRALQAGDTALTLYQLWLGASLLAKLRRDASPFEHATRSTELLLS